MIKPPQNHLFKIDTAPAMVVPPGDSTAFRSWAGCLRSILEDALHLAVGRSPRSYTSEHTVC